jgi:hypothetical protein
VSRPTTVLEAITSAAATTPSLLSILSVAHPQLKAGTKYWVVVTTAGDAAVEWYVDPFSPRGVSLQFLGSSAWTVSGGSTRGTVELLAGVPEPASARLCLAGILLFAAGGVGLSRRR